VGQKLKNAEEERQVSMQVTRVLKNTKALIIFGGKIQKRQDNF